VPNKYQKDGRHERGHEVYRPLSPRFLDLYFGMGNKQQKEPGRIKYLAKNENGSFKCN
jgi:hypothetical protein